MIFLIEEKRMIKMISEKLIVNHDLDEPVDWFDVNERDTSCEVMESETGETVEESRVESCE